MHRGVEIHSGKRDPHGTADVVELYGTPPCPLANSPGKYKEPWHERDSTLFAGFVHREHIRLRRFRSRAVNRPDSETRRSESAAENALCHVRGRVIGGTYSRNERTSKYRFQALEIEGPLRFSAPLAMLVGSLRELQFTSEIVDEATSALNGADPDKNLRGGNPCTSPSVRISARRTGKPLASNWQTSCVGSEALQVTLRRGSIHAAQGKKLLGDPSSRNHEHRGSGVCLQIRKRKRK